MEAELKSRGFKKSGKVAHSYRQRLIVARLNVPHRSGAVAAVVP